MADGYEVLVDELRAHAARLDALRDQLNTAVDAARTVTLGTEAYGKICAFFVPAVNAVSEPGVEALGRTAETMGETATRVRDTATGYEQVEDANTRPFAGGGGR